MQRRKVLVAMSGGVDSSVAAALLAQDGWEVIGCFMRLGSVGEEVGASTRIRHRGCCSIDDAEDARRVAAKLGVPFYSLNFKEEFGRVMDYFVEEYNAGRTPNPCIRCNDWLKFGRLAEFAESIGAEAIATGHYAKIEHSAAGHPQLHRAADTAKDQSYVLFGAAHARLASMLLPIGHLRKDEVRSLASKLGLPVATKPDSQDICFVPDGDHTEFIQQRAPGAMRAGRVRDSGGADLGEHDGHQRFTVGQRRGVGVATAIGVPLYVLNKDAATNCVTLGRREDLVTSSCQLAEAAWLTDASREWLDCQVQVRAHGATASARIRGCAGADGKPGISVEFAQPTGAVAPGQAAVCYDGDRVIAGGWVESTR